MTFGIQMIQCDQSVDNNCPILGKKVAKNVAEPKMPKYLFESTKHQHQTIYKTSF